MMTADVSTGSATARGRCAVLGSPIAHSLSPAMHQCAYQLLGLDWTYEAIEAQTDELAAILGRRDNNGADWWTGLSLTMPLKRAIVGLADEVSDTTKQLGVANTVIFSAGKRIAHNTDVPGAVSAIQQAGISKLYSARILGAGATAISMAQALIRMGVSTIEFRVRSTQRAESALDLVRGTGVEASAVGIEKPILDVVDILASTVPNTAVSSRAYEFVDAARAVFDVIYDPWPTTLAQAAAEGGRTVIGGLDLLAHQAVRQVRLMTGFQVSAAALREAALHELAVRG